MTMFEPVDPVRCRLGEGPSWVSEAGELWWVDLSTGTWFRRHWVTGSIIARTLGERVSIALPSADAAAYVALGKDWVVVDGRETRVLVTVEADVVDTFINDARTGPDGKLYFGTFDRQRRDGICGLYRLDDHGATRIADDVVISNGIDWAPSGEVLYVVDSHRHQVLAFDFDAERGSAMRRRVLIDVPRSAGMPDGMTVDAGGDIWVALYGGGAIHRYDSKGRLLARLQTPVVYPTSCCFATDTLDTLVVTSGFARIVAAGEKPSDLDGAIFAARVDAVGQAARTAQASGSGLGIDRQT